jgi:hypothetical protein
LAVAGRRETTAGLPLVEALLGEMRRRRIVIPGISVVERLAAAVLHDAEREIWSTIAGRLGEIRTRRLEMLLEEQEHERQSRFSWLREPVGLSAMNAILDRLDVVRRIALDRAVTAGVPAARLRQLAREGARLTAQGLRQMTPLRRRAIPTATVLELEADLTDAALDALGASLSRALAVARRKREAETSTERAPVTRPSARSPRWATPSLRSEPLAGSWRMPSNAQWDGTSSAALLPVPRTCSGTIRMTGWPC